MHSFKAAFFLRKEFPLAVDKTQTVLSFTTDMVSVAGSILKLFNTFSLHKCTNLL